MEFYDGFRNFNIILFSYPFIFIRQWNNVIILKNKTETLITSSRSFLLTLQGPLLDSKDLDPIQGVATNSGLDGGRSRFKSGPLLYRKNEGGIKESNVSSSC